MATGCPGGKTVRLAISTAVILKEEGFRVRFLQGDCSQPQVSGTGPFLFLFLFCFSVFVLFCLFVCVFVCLMIFLITGTGTGLKLVSERTAKVNKMKNKYICWIVDNYAVCLSVIFIWNLFEVVGKVHVGPLILNFLFVCFCFVLFCVFETDPIPSCLCVARVFASNTINNNIFVDAQSNKLAHLWAFRMHPCSFFTQRLSWWCRYSIYVMHYSKRYL